MTQPKFTKTQKETLRHIKMMSNANDKVNVKICKGVGKEKARGE